MQHPTVLIRVTAEARDGLLALRKRTENRSGGGGPVENLGQVVARLVDAEKAHLAQLAKARNGKKS